MFGFKIDEHGNEIPGELPERLPSGNWSDPEDHTLGSHVAAGRDESKKSAAPAVPPEDEMLIDTGGGDGDIPLEGQSTKPPATGNSALGLKSPSPGK